MKNPYTKIDSNIVNYLFVGIPCPVCRKPIVVSLGTLYRKESFRCTECNQRSAYVPRWHNTLWDFVISFDSLYARLQKNRFSLMFSYNPPFATIWSQDDN